MNSQRGYSGHKRRKKGARSHFKRRKNEFRLRAQENKERQMKDKQNTNTTSTSLSDRTNLVHERPSSAFMNINLPPHWQVSSHLDEVQYTKLLPNENGIIEVRSTVIVHPDLTWSVYFQQKPVPHSSRVLPQASTTPSPSMVLQLLDRIDNAEVCPGNPDGDFVQICQKRGGTMNGKRGNGRRLLPLIAREL